MKKVFAVTILSVLLMFCFTSCKKVVDKIFNGIDAKAPDYTIGLPAVPAIAVGMEIQGPVVTRPFNLDSIIRANSGGVFGINDVKSVKLKSIAINVPDADNNNRLGNFERTTVTLSSNTNSNPVNLATINFPDTATNSITVSPTNPPELLNYLKGSQISYQSTGKARRSTSKPLTFVISMIMRVE